MKLIKSRKLLSSLLIVVLVATMLCMDCTFANALDGNNNLITGSVGEYYTYSLNLDEKTIEFDVSGTPVGELDFFKWWECDPWTNNNYREAVEKVIFKSGLKAVSQEYRWYRPEHWLYDFPNLKEISVETDNTSYASQDGILFSKDMKTLLVYPSRKEGDIYVVPDYVETIECYGGSSAFTLAKNLKTVEIGKSVKGLEHNPFTNPEVGNNSIEKIEVSNENQNYVAIDGVLFSKDGGTIVAYPAGKKADVYEIPSTVKVIGKDAFAGSYIKSFVISEGVEKIEKDAFFNMRGHCDTITIPASVTYIGSGAFKYGYEVNTVNFTKGTKLSTFPSNAFSDEHLTINIPCDVNWSFTEEETKRITVNKIHSFTKYTYNNNAKVGVDGTETAICDNGCGIDDTRVKIGSALSGGGSFGGGGYVPPTSESKPIISEGNGYSTIIGDNGKTVLVLVDEGYELVDVKVNGISIGSQNKITGLKNSDKIEIEVAKKEEPSEVEKVQAELKTVTKENFKARSSLVKLKSGKTAVKIVCVNDSGVEFDGIEVFRSEKKSSSYGKKPIFTTKTGKYYNTSVEKGKKYYYRVRGYIEVDGVKYYSDWSAKAYRTVK